MNTLTEWKSFKQGDEIEAWRTPAPVAVRGRGVRPPLDRSHGPSVQPRADGEPTDEQLMEQIQHGDEAALAALQRRHSALLRTIIRRMISNDHDADELVLECLLEIWRHASNYCVEKGNALGWIVTLVRRRTIDRIRRKMAYNRTRDRLREEAASSGVSTQPGADEDAARTDTAEAVSKLISHLPAAQQQVVHLAFYRGMSQREIAAHTGIPLGTIKTRLELGLRKLRSAVLAFGELHEPHPAAHRELPREAVPT